MEGIHRRKPNSGETGTIALHAFALISYDPDKLRYRFDSYTDETTSGDFAAAIVNRGFQWTMELPDMTIRYLIEHTDDDQWFETGEISEHGAKWQKFFEMTLHRVPVGPAPTDPAAPDQSSVAAAPNQRHDATRCNAYAAPPNPAVAPLGRGDRQRRVRSDRGIPA